MSFADDYFARVRPLLGDGLSACAVRVDDADIARLVLELLASCMLQRIEISRPETAERFVREHAWRQPFVPLSLGAIARPDASIIARLPAAGEPIALHWDSARREVTMVVDPSDVFAWMDASYHVARDLRDALLGRIAWPSGTRWLAHPAWPFTPVPAPPPREPGAAIGALRGRHVLVVGCGSLGSEAIRPLAGHGARWTLIDDARVTVFNLARQWYGANEVGMHKASALRDRLAATGDQADAWLDRVDGAGLAALEARLRADPPDVALLATGTHHHGLVGELLWRLGIPHVAACCYPQARYFEVNIASPADRSPCLHCFRGHIYRGTPEPAPLTDEVARFLYRPMDDAARTRAYQDLVAEPATKIETSRAAELLARCALELCAPRRSHWFDRVIASATTCLLGGNMVHELAPGDFAYGIREPGQVIRLGPEDVTGSEATITCDVCARQLDVALRESALPVLGDEADALFIEDVRP